MTITNIEEAIYSVMTGDTATALKALVSSRIYSLTLPQEASLPAITFFRISGLRNHGMGGDISLMESRIQVSIWADSLKETRAVADAVRGVMQRWKGTYGNVVVQDSLLDNEYDDFDVNSENYQCVHDYRIFHT